MGLDVRTMILAAPVIIFSLTVHEFFHAWTADRCGDSTARHMGRLTLNPLAHLDLYGTIVMVVSEFHFGWARPVPVNPYNLRHPRRDNFWISAAGPLSNLGMAFLTGSAIRGLIAADLLDFHGGAFRLMFNMVSINLTLAIFNLLPLFPLDGSHIFRSILPSDFGPMIDQIDQVAPYILLVLIVSGFFLHFSILSMILGPFVRAGIYLFSGL